MPKKQQITVITAAGCGLAATVIAWAFLESQAIEEEPIRYREILIASGDLSPNSLIEETDIAEIKVPDTPDYEALYAIALKPEERPIVVNRRASRAIPAGKPLMYADLTNFEELQIRSGMVALSVQASGADGVGGLLVPGDLVHMIVTSPKATEPDPSMMGGSGADAMSAAMFASVLGGSNEYESETVAKDVRVLAVGTSLNRARAGFLLGDAGYNPMRDTSSVITLEVTLAMAESILARSGAGRHPITLLLAEPRREDATR